MSESIPPPPKSPAKRISSKTILFLVALIVVAVVSGGVIYYIMKANEPKAYWNSVRTSPTMPTNTLTWTSPNFEITRKMGLRWDGAVSAIQNAYCDVDIYTSGGYFIQTVRLNPSTDPVTEVNVHNGNYYITAKISGAVSSNEMMWQVYIYDQLYF